MIEKNLTARCKTKKCEVFVNWIIFKWTAIFDLIY